MRYRLKIEIDEMTTDPSPDRQVVTRSTTREIEYLGPECDTHINKSGNIGVSSQERSRLLRHVLGEMADDLVR